VIFTPGFLSHQCDAKNPVHCFPLFQAPWPSSPHEFPSPSQLSPERKPPISQLCFLFFFFFVPRRFFPCFSRKAFSKAHPRPIISLPLYSGIEGFSSIFPLCDLPPAAYERPFLGFRLAQFFLFSPPVSALDQSQSDIIRFFFKYRQILNFSQGRCFFLFSPWSLPFLLFQPGANPSIFLSRRSTS